MIIKNYFLRAFKSRHAVPLLCIILGVIFANSIYLFTSANPNPLYQRANLTTSSTPGRLDGRNTIDPNDGFTSQALGHLTAKDWLSGSVPYWNHYEGVGTPLAGEMQSVAFFPLAFLLGFSNGLLFFHIALEIIAGLATYYLLVLLKLSRKIAVFAGLAFALNGTHAWLTNAVFNPIAFLPLLLLGVEMAYQASSERRKRGWILISIAIAASFYAGFPEVAYLDGLLGVTWAATRFLQLKKPDLRKSFARKLVVAGSIGLMLAAPLLVAFYEYTKYANVGTHASAHTFGLVPIGLSSFFMPYIFGPIFGLFSYDTSGQLLVLWSRVGGYVTASLIVLALFGITGQKDRLLKRVLAGWVVVTVLGTYGLFRIMYVLNLIPGIDKAAFYRYAAPSFEMAIVVLAAFGIAELANGKIAKKTRVAVASIMAVLIAAGVINALPEMHRLLGAPHNRLWAAASITAAAGSTLLIFATQLIAAKKIRTYAIIAIVLLDIVVMFMLPELSTPRHQHIDTRPVTYLQQHIGDYRFFTLGPIQPNYGSYYNIAEVNINDVPIPASYSTYITKDLNSNTNPLVFTGLNMVDPHTQTALQAFIANFSSYEALGVKYLVAQKDYVTPSVSALTGMKKVFASPAADIFELPNPKPYLEVMNGSCQLQPRSRDNIQVTCKQPSTLLRREQFMPGWTAKAGARSPDVTEYNHLFQTVRLPAGTYDLTYNYAPPHIPVAYAAFVLGLVAIGASYVMPSRPRPAPKAPKKPKPPKRSA